MASAGSAPAASLKQAVRRSGNTARRRGIRGVCPRGLIEAGHAQGRRHGELVASAGSAPAASLKRDVAVVDRDMLSSIRGVCPRGLIEATPLVGHARDAHGIRGVCPRGLIEATVSRPCRSRRRVASIRGVCPRGLIEAVDLPPAQKGPARPQASAGSAPAASLKPSSARKRRSAPGGRASAGSAPAASLKLVQAVGVVAGQVASAGSAPAASLKPVRRGGTIGHALGASAGSAPAASLKR